MVLEQSELTLLEDCQDDWRGLWEAAWEKPDDPLSSRVVLVSSLVDRGLLKVLPISNWPEARTAAALPHDEAVALVRDAESYAAPEAGHAGQFYVLSITPEGDAAVAACHAGHG